MYLAYWLLTTFCNFLKKVLQQEDTKIETAQLKEETKLTSQMKRLDKLAGRDAFDAFVEVFDKPLKAGMLSILMYLIQH